MAALALWTVVLLSWALVIRTHQRVTLVIVALLGLTIYSIPALVGLAFPPIGQSAIRQWAAVPDSGRYAMAIAWLGTTSTMLVAQTLFGAGRPVKEVAPTRSSQLVTRNFIVLTVVASLLGFAYAVYRGGPLFFLGSRGEIGELIYSEAFLLWRWINVLGLVVALAARRKLPFLFFIGAVTINFLMGDRTVIILGGMSALALFLWQAPVTAVVRSRRVLIALGTLAFVTFFGKILYSAAKVGGLATLSNSFLFDLNLTLMNFEPFLVQYLLDSVIEYNLTVTTGEILLPAFAQLLVVPSVFGVDSGSYNVLLTETLFPNLNFGIAFSYWAQGYSWLGYFGVFVYGVIFAFSAIGLSKAANSSPTLWRCLWIICGTIVAIYAHRNSLENTIAFLRQVVLGFLPLYLLAYLSAALERR